ADVHGTARYSDRFRFETGGAFSAVPDPSLELHGSALYQRASELTVPAAAPGPQALLSPDGALVTQQLHNAYKALGGFTWTFENGWSFIGEAWYDGSAPGSSDWQRLAAQADRRNMIATLPGVPAAAVEGSMAAATRMFQQPSLTRR